MSAGKGGYQVFHPYDLELDARSIQRRADQADIEVVSSDRVSNIVAAEFGQAKVDVWELPPHRSYHGWQQGDRDGGDETGLDVADLAAGCPPRGCAEASGPVEKAPGFVEEEGSGFCETDRHAAGTGEERYTEFVLKLANLHAERRLRDVQALGRAAEVEFLGHSDEVAQPPEVERR
jgi:hypothetical protein